jgi:MFS family permease
VSNAGGLGSFGAVILSPAQIAETVAALRAATSRPFAMNLWVPLPNETTAISPAEFARAAARLAPFYARLGVTPPELPVRVERFEDQVAALLDARPPVWSFIMGVPPADLLEDARRRGIVTIGTATTVEEARLLDEAGVDLIIASGAAGMLVGAVIAMRVRPRRPLRFAGLAMTLTVVPLSLLAGAEHRVLLIATASLAGAALALFQIMWQTALQEHVPQDELSRVTAWNWLGLLVLFPLGLLLAGPFSDLVGVTQTVWLSAATIVVLVLVGFCVPSMRNLPSRAAEEAAARASASGDSLGAGGRGADA